MGTIKIHCSLCEGFIKDITLAEVSNLTGTEICQECKAKLNTVMVELRKIHIGYEKQLEELYTKAKADLDKWLTEPLQGNKVSIGEVGRRIKK